jgi:hypothetical protein
LKPEPTKPALVDRSPPSDALQAYIADAREEFARMVDVAELRGDPVGKIVQALGIHLAVQAELARRWETVPVEEITSQVEAMVSRVLVERSAALVRSAQKANTGRTALRTALAASGVGVALLALAAAGAYQWGWAARDAALLRQCSGAGATGCTLWFKSR